MTLITKLVDFAATMGSIIRHPHRSYLFLRRLSETIRGSDFCDQWTDQALQEDSNLLSKGTSLNGSDNRLWSYFDSHKKGRGIWKWIHYFDIYHRHLYRFVGKDVHIVEIGVYSGGSLTMWKQYFGPKSFITGVDIQEACKSYENEYTRIFIGDQADRSFWKTFREQSSPIDIIIDDGGHQTEQQIVTLEELLPYIRPGGVYICEDVHGSSNRFTGYLQSLVDKLNTFVKDTAENLPGQITSIATPFQESIYSVHFYPFIVVIEKTSGNVKRFIAPKHGTEWQPFL